MTKIAPNEEKTPFFHLTWSGLVFQTFWLQATDFVNDCVGHIAPLFPKLSLSGISGHSINDHNLTF